MRLMNLVLVFAILAGLVILPKPIVPTLAQDTPSFESAPCTVELPDGMDEGEDILCGYVTVPEQHSDPNGPIIRLAVAILPSTNETPAEPLFMAQGGPGGSTLDYFVEALDFVGLDDVFRESRDVVLVDQRGTLYSEPALLCDEEAALTYDTLDDILTLDEEDSLYLETMQACRTRLENEGVNLSAYDSVENAADMNDVRLALGYDQIYFYGVSYGTMLVQHYMRDFPETLRGAIIDSVVPLSYNFIPQVAFNAQRSLDLLFDSCAADEICNNAYPDLENEFYALVDSWNQTPITLSITDEEGTGQTYQAVFDGNDLLDITFQMLYVTDVIPLLPLIIWDSKNANYDILSLIHGLITFDFTLATGMYNSVMCAEDADFTLDEVNLEGVSPLVQEVFAVDTFEPLCSLWNVESLDSYVDDAVVSDIPTLVMSGEFDPITPPYFADIAAESLLNAFVYTFPGVGHGAYDTDCASGIFLEFLADPFVQPNTDCIADMGITFLTR